MTWAATHDTARDRHVREPGKGAARRPARLLVIMVICARRSLAHAKAHLSELVDAAEHHGKRIMILRHGKPAAAIVPAAVAAPRLPETKPMSAKEAERSIRAFIAEFSATDPDVSAVADLLEGRR